MKRFVIIFIISCMFIIPSMGQSAKDGIIVFGRVVDGDTIPYISLKEVKIFAFRDIDSKWKQRKLNKLIRNVKKVYPYAKIAGIEFEKYNKILAEIEDPKEKRRIMRELEKELMAEYEDDLRNFTFSQGKILIKLVDRELGNSSYNILQDFRGNFIAFFWQGFARVFGFNLKTRYDPEDADRVIEIIVQMIETGQI